jgi:hypothetical protein
MGIGAESREKNSSGAKAQVDFAGVDIRAKALTYQSRPDASCGLDDSRKHSSGEKARADSVGHARGLKPPSPSASRFSAAFSASAFASLPERRGTLPPQVSQANTMKRGHYV